MMLIESTVSSSSSPNFAIRARRHFSCSSRASSSFPRSSAARDRLLRAMRNTSSFSSTVSRMISSKRFCIA